jgi:hypothetical protein
MSRAGQAYACLSTRLGLAVPAAVAGPDDVAVEPLDGVDVVAAV